MVRYIVLDAETTVRNKGEDAIGDMVASPYSSKNEMVALGLRFGGDNYIEYKYPHGAVDGFSAWYQYIADPCVDDNEKLLLVGHNLPFDLKYLKKHHPSSFEEALKNIYIWDTQQVAYLLSGQTHMYPALDELCEEIGHSLKDQKIKEYWDNGVATEDIPAEELCAYLAHDLESTEAVFKYQYQLVKDNPALFNLIRMKMDDILATTMMEENGMAFDIAVAHKEVGILETQINLHEMLAESMVNEEAFNKALFNPMSNEHVSLAMFGGTLAVDERVTVLDEHGFPLYYKSGAKAGQQKTRMEKVMYDVVGMGLKPPAGAVAKKGIYPVGDEVLSKYPHMPFCGTIQKLRELNKTLETYFLGYSKLVWPDGCIHPSINHCSTRTGRQSFTKPNLQNVSRND